MTGRFRLVKKYMVTYTGGSEVDVYWSDDSGWYHHSVKIKKLKTLGFDKGLHTKSSQVYVRMNASTQQEIDAAKRALRNHSTHSNGKPIFVVDEYDGTDPECWSKSWKVVIGTGVVLVLSFTAVAFSVIGVMTASIAAVGASICWAVWTFGHNIIKPTTNFILNYVKKDLPLKTGRPDFLDK
jgi:hypothetical protein